MRSKKAPKPEDLNVLDLVFVGQYVKVLVDMPIVEHQEDGSSRTDLTVFFGYYLGSDNGYIYLGTVDTDGQGMPQFALNKRYIIIVELSEPKTEQDMILSTVETPKEEDIN